MTESTNKPGVTKTPPVPPIPIAKAELLVLLGLAETQIQSHLLTGMNTPVIQAFREGQLAMLNTLRPYIEGLTAQDTHG